MAVRADSAGVEIVYNDVPGPALLASADTVLVFGGDETGLASFYRVREPVVDVDGSGHIYVLNPSEHRVVGYTSDGVPFRSWGRQGQGPGEFVSPLSVTVSIEGGPVVHDPGRGIFSRFSRDGSFIGQEQAPGVLNTSLRQVESVGGGLVMWARHLDAAAEPIDQLIQVIKSDTLFLVAGRPSLRSNAHHVRCGVTFGVAIPLSPRLYWSQWQERIAVVTDADYKIDLFEGGRHVRRVKVGQPARELTREEVIHVLEADSVRGPCNSAPEEFIALHGYYPRLQRIRDLALAPDGTLWVLSLKEDGVEEITLFDATGEAMGTLPVGFPMPLTFLPDGRALIQIVDDLEIERLGLARVVFP
jgi:hypothetical protein